MQFAASSAVVAVRVSGQEPISDLNDGVRPRSPPELDAEAAEAHTCKHTLGFLPACSQYFLSSVPFLLHTEHLFSSLLRTAFMEVHRVKKSRQSYDKSRPQFDRSGDHTGRMPRSLNN